MEIVTGLIHRMASVQGATLFGVSAKPWLLVPSNLIAMASNLIAWLPVLDIGPKSTLTMLGHHRPLLTQTDFDRLHTEGILVHANGFCAGVPPI